MYVYLYYIVWYIIILAVHGRGERDGYQNLAIHLLIFISIRTLTESQKVAVEMMYKTLVM